MRTGSASQELSVRFTDTKLAKHDNDITNYNKKLYQNNFIEKRRYIFYVARPMLKATHISKKSFSRWIS